jgi:hypothetical protein
MYERTLREPRRSVRPKPPKPQNPQKNPKPQGLTKNTPHKKQKRDTEKGGRTNPNPRRATRGQRHETPKSQTQTPKKGSKTPPQSPNPFPQNPQVAVAPFPKPQKPPAARPRSPVFEVCLLKNLPTQPGKARAANLIAIACTGTRYAAAKKMLTIQDEMHSCPCRSLSPLELCACLSLSLVHVQHQLERSYLLV